MPATTTSPTRQRNDAIRAWAESNVPTFYPANYRASRTAAMCFEADGLSERTVANILRGRDLQPTNRRSRRQALGGATRALGFDRRFGAEIEFFGIDRYVVQSALDRGDLPAGWSVKSDCSVTGQANGRYCSGLELVSPPLRGEDGIDSVRKACRWLRENGGRVNSSCGLHVHHEARDLGAEGIARVARLYTDHQSLLNWLVSSSRRGGSNYALPMTEDNARYIERSGGRSASTRYLAVNVNSFPRHGTVEFRQHQGTLNAQKIEAWIRLGQGLCDAAAERSQVSESGLRGLLGRLQVDEDASAFLLGRAVQFQAPAQVVAS